MSGGFMTHLRRSMIVLILGFLAAPLLAQTTGSISGHVTDASGGALPGVTVDAKSSAMQGARTTVSDSGGAYRFTLLPPGNYALSFTLAGFGQLKQPSIVVSLGKDTAVDAVLSPSVTEGITVSA